MPESFVLKGVWCRVFIMLYLEGTYGNTYQKNLLNCKEGGSGFLSVLKLAGIHGNTFMLKCIKCNAGFSRGLQVDAHIQTQTGENPFYCQEC